MNKLPAHLFVSSDGHMFDTRREDWSNHPLRHGYGAFRQHLPPKSTIALRAAIRAAYAWPGGYASIGITSDGGVLCCKCMRKEFRQISWSIRHDVSDGWKVVATGHVGDCDEEPVCDHCSKPVGEVEE